MSTQPLPGAFELDSISGSKEAYRVTEYLKRLIVNGSIDFSTIPDFIKSSVEILEFERIPTSRGDTPLNQYASQFPNLKRIIAGTRTVLMTRVGPAFDPTGYFDSWYTRQQNRPKKIYVIDETDPAVVLNDAKLVIPSNGSIPVEVRILFIDRNATCTHAGTGLVAYHNMATRVTAWETKRFLRHHPDGPTPRASASQLNSNSWIVLDSTSDQDTWGLSEGHDGEWDMPGHFPISQE